MSFLRDCSALTSSLSIVIIGKRHLILHHKKRNCMKELTAKLHINVVPYGVCSCSSLWEKTPQLVPEETEPGIITHDALLFNETLMT